MIMRIVLMLGLVAALAVNVKPEVWYGPPGPTGPAGPQGPAGRPGRDGVDGPQGAEKRNKDLCAYFPTLGPVVAPPSHSAHAHACTHALQPLQTLLTGPCYASTNFSYFRESSRILTTHKQTFHSHPITPAIHWRQ